MVKSVSALLLLLLVFTGSVNAQEAKVRGKHFNIKKGVAIRGYDPVSYFSGQPLEGSEHFEYTYKGVNYYFNNSENKATFEQNPDKYEPQYGGWCAYAIGETGDKVKIDPKTYQILDGKLYLFYNFKGLNTLESWKKDQSNLKNKADHNWSKTIH